MVREHLLTVCRVWSLLTGLDCASSGPSMLVPGTALPRLGPKPASLTICLSLVKFLERGKEGGRSLFRKSYLEGLRS